MRIGLCTGDRAEIRTVRVLGFDYVELPKADALSEASRAMDEGWPVDATNLFFAADDSLAKGLNEDWWERLDSELETLAEIGVATVVVGSGRQRSGDEARFVEVAARLSFAARKFGLTLAPENLRPQESDVGTDVTALASALAAMGVGYTVDVYHVRQTDPDRPWDAILTRCPAHVHIADTARQAPEGNDPDLRAFMTRLRELGYDGRVSYEGGRDVPLAETASRLRELVK